VAGLAAMTGIGVSVACVDSPFLSCIRRSVDLAGNGPYLEVVSWLRTHPYLVGRAFDTLNHFDIMHFARRAGTRALFSVAMMDDTCPPSTAWAAYNRWGETGGGVMKDINVYPFAQHPGGEEVQTWNQLGLLEKIF
jgi:cephalosporin-C deacetylase